MLKCKNITDRSNIYLEYDAEYGGVFLTTYRGTTAQNKQLAQQMTECLSNANVQHALATYVPNNLVGNWYLDRKFNCDYYDGVSIHRQHISQAFKALGLCRTFPDPMDMHNTHEEIDGKIPEDIRQLIEQLLVPSLGYPPSASVLRA